MAAVDLDQLGKLELGELALFAVERDVQPQRFILALVFRLHALALLFSLFYDGRRTE